MKIEMICTSVSMGMDHAHAHFETKAAYEFYKSQEDGEGDGGDQPSGVAYGAGYEGLVWNLSVTVPTKGHYLEYRVGDVYLMDLDEK